MKNRAAYLFLALFFSTAFAAGRIPDAQIPPSVAAELKQIENQFELALAQDCPVEKCFSRGCSYVSHATADKPKQGSLPGIGDERGPGATVAQEFLTAARCEIATETSIPAKDRQTLVKRLEQKLGSGYTVVSVEARQLPPLPDSLKPTPTPAVGAIAPTSPAPEGPSSFEQKLAEKDWTKEGLFREFWLSMLPFFPWMLGAILLTLCTQALIWAYRRLGKQTVEERLMEASLSATPAQPLDLPDLQKSSEKNSVIDVEAEEKAFAAAQQTLWRTRAAKEPQIIKTLFVNWLKEGDFPLLAKAVLEFDSIIKPEFPENGELARRKLEFSEFLKEAKPDSMPKDAEFYRVLNQHALVASILAQSDAEVYTRIREEFGPSGIRQLMNSMPRRLAAVLFTLISRSEQNATALMLSESERKEIARELMRSNRASREELGTVLSAARAVCQELPLPAFTQTSSTSDHGQEIGAAAALSVILPSLPAQVRKDLVRSSLETTGGIAPTWMQRVFYPEMLLATTTDLRTSLMLNTDLPSLVAWLAEQPIQFRERLKANIPLSLANALAAAAAGPRANPSNAEKALAENLMIEFAAHKIQWIDLVSA